MAQMARRHFSSVIGGFIVGAGQERKPTMKAAEADIDWMCANEDLGLIEACRAAASIAAQFEAARPVIKGRKPPFNELFSRLYFAARSAARG
ncbi:MAG: hypothetical protein K2Q06_05765 [Parvularculaceae bacterium]|nr:hypothetical protein [Parvularculaceae bacterium]